MTDGPATFVEYKHRIVYSLFRAAVKVGLRLGLTMNAMVKLLRMAAFEQARQEQGRELAEIAAIFGKSLRTVSGLHREYRGEFFKPERDIALRRDVAALLARRPADLDGIAAHFEGLSSIELAAAVADLEREKRIVRHGGLLHRNPEDRVFYDDNDIARRVDGLNRQMDIVADTVWNRLVDAEAGHTAIARSYVFQAHPDRFEALLDRLTDSIRDNAIAADAATRVGDGAHGRCAITLAATPLLDNE